MEWPIYFMYGCGYEYCDMYHESWIIVIAILAHHYFYIVKILFLTWLGLFYCIYGGFIQRIWLIIKCCHFVHAQTLCNCHQRSCEISYWKRNRNICQSRPMQYLQYYINSKTMFEKIYPSFRSVLLAGIQRHHSLCAASSGHWQEWSCLLFL